MKTRLKYYKNESDQRLKQQHQQNKTRVVCPPPLLKGQTRAAVPDEVGRDVEVRERGVQRQALRHRFRPIPARTAAHPQRHADITLFTRERVMSACGTARDGPARKAWRSASGFTPARPIPAVQRELGTNKTVMARCWPRLEPFSGKSLYILLLW